MKNIKILQEFDIFEWQVRIQKTYKGKVPYAILRIQGTGTWCRVEGVGEVLIYVK